MADTENGHVRFLDQTERQLAPAEKVNDYYNVIKRKGREPYPAYLLWILVFIGFFGTISGFVISLWGTVKITWEPEYIVPQSLQIITNATGAVETVHTQSLLLMLAESGCSLVNAALISNKAPNRTDVNVFDPNSYRKFKIMSCQMNFIMNADNSGLQSYYLRVKDLQVVSVIFIGVLLPLWILVEYNRGYLDRYYRRYLYYKDHPETIDRKVADTIPRASANPDASVDYMGFALIAESKLWARLYRPVWSVAGVGDRISVRMRLRVFLTFAVLASVVAMMHSVVLVLLSHFSRSFLEFSVFTLSSFPDVQALDWNYSYSYFICGITAAVNMILCVSMLAYSFRLYVYFPSSSDFILTM